MRDNSKRLSQREGGAAYNLAVDDDVHAIGADSECARAQIVDVLAIRNSKVRARVGGAGVNGFVDRSADAWPFVIVSPEMFTVLPELM
jgi:hypothetical protein